MGMLSIPYVPKQLDIRLPSHKLLIHKTWAFCNLNFAIAYIRYGGIIVRA